MTEILNLTTLEWSFMAKNVLFNCFKLCGWNVCLYVCAALSFRNIWIRLLWSFSECSVQIAHIYILGIDTTDLLGTQLKNKCG